MSEQETATAEQETESKTFTEDQVRELLEKETGGLKAKVEELLGESKAAKAKAREAAERATREAEEKAKASGNVEALEKSWTEKFTTREQELTGVLSEKDAIISRLTAGAAAKDIAAELALKGSERVLEQIIAPRFGVEIVEGQPKVIVKDAAGQRSALTLEDLRKEILSDAALKPILQGTKGSGAGGAGPNGGAASQKTVTRTSWDSMSHSDRGAFIKNGGKVVDA